MQAYAQLVYDEEELTLDDELVYPQTPYFSQFLEYKDAPYHSYNGFKG